MLHHPSHLLVAPTFSLLVDILPISEAALVLHQYAQALGFLGSLFKRNQSKPHLALPLDHLSLPGAGTGDEQVADKPQASEPVGLQLRDRQALYCFFSSLFPERVT